MLYLKILDSEKLRTYYLLNCIFIYFSFLLASPCSLKHLKKILLEFLVNPSNRCYHYSVLKAGNEKDI
jgi:hypothetical protein